MQSDVGLFRLVAGSDGEDASTLEEKDVEKERKKSLKKRVK